MKKLNIVIVFILLLVGCKSIEKTNITNTQKGNTFIPYILQLEAEKITYDAVKSTPKNKKISFNFDFKKDGTIDVWIDTNSNGLYSEKDRLTRRKLFVNDRFYPLSFNLDERFGVELENDTVKIGKHCGYYKPKRKETNEIILMPSLSEREKLFPYVKESPCQLGILKTIVARHQGFLFTMDIDGNVIN